MNIADSIAIFNDITWREPLWILLALIPALPSIISLLFDDGSKRFADKHLLPWATHHQEKNIFHLIFSKKSAYIFSFLLIAISAAGPRLPADALNNKLSADIDIMIVIDVSQSMHVDDISPNRLQRARIEAEELLSHAAGTRIGIVVFSARPHLLVPLTSDHDAVRYYLKYVDELVLPTLGSDSFSALEMAFTELDSKNPSSAIIVISDGDFPGMPTQFKQIEKRSSVPIYVLGVGSASGGAIPTNNGQWLKYEGKSIISRLNKNNLLNLASGSGDNKIEAHYALASDGDSDWDKLYDRGIFKLANKPKSNIKNVIIWNELFYWALFPAIILLWISLIPFSTPKINTPKISTPKTSSVKNPKVKNGSFGANIFIPTLLIIFIGTGLSDVAHAKSIGDIKIADEVGLFNAYTNYNKGNYSLAITAYEKISGYEARIGQGSSYYKLKNYNSAIRQFSKSVLKAKTDKERSNALFNLGNSYFQRAEYSTAVLVYKDALIYQPLQRKVEHNLKFSQTLKEAIEQRIQSANQGARMGTGPQLAPSADIIENNQTSSLAMDQSDEADILDLPLPNPDTLLTTEFEQLIQKGLNRIKLSSKAGDSSAYQTQIQTRLSAINAQLLMSKVQDHPAELWKRLFEMEEGFPSPLSKPRNVPGVSPW